MYTHFKITGTKSAIVALKTLYYYVLCLGNAYFEIHVILIIMYSHKSIKLSFSFGFAKDMAV